MIHTMAESLMGWWATVHSEKIKKLTTVDLFNEILNNFAMILMFGKFKFILISLVAHLKN